MRKKLFQAAMIMVMIFIVASCAKISSPGTGQAVVDFAEYQLQKPRKGDTIAVFTTSHGTFKAKLFPEETPRTVENFTTHAKNGYYDGLTFHRIVEDFVIQGGDPSGNGTGGESIWGTPFKDEFSTRLYNYRGALSMANSGGNTNGSQFFIVQKSSISEEEIQYMKYFNYLDSVVEKYKKLGGAMWLDNKHSVIGQVYEGMDVVDKIASLPVKNESGEPQEKITIEKIEIQIYGE